MIQRKDFPTGFLFGSASSAYQYEGAAKEGGKGPNICDTFAERYPERIQDRSTGFNAADSYHRYKDDVQLMKKMGFTAYRFSFAWSRILPGGKLSAGVNREGIEYYNNLINELVANDIEPFVTLFHWDVPQALEDEYGGFLSPNIILDFCDYAELCFWEFGDRVKNWITLNEPWSFCVGGYVEGNLPPGRGTIPKPAAKVRMHAPMETKSTISLYSGNQYANQHQIVNYPYGRYSGWDDNIYPMISTLSSNDRMFSTRSSNDLVISTMSYDGPTDDVKKYGDPGVEPYKVAHNQLLAHAAAVHLYKDNYQGSQQGKIGISLVSEWMVPLDETSAVDKACKERALDFMLGWFLGPITCGKYPKTMIDNVGGRLPNEKELEVVKGTYDFIGVNYYTAAYATMPDKDETGEKKPDTYRTDRNVKLPREKNGKFIGKRGASVWLFSYPEGIRMLLSYIKKNYCDPIIYITENGFDTFTNVELSKACADDDRMEYYQDHLKSIQKAITDDKVNVKGYFAWSLLDNYEWNMGYTSGFGLMHVDIKNGFTRYPKQSAIWFQKFLCA